MPRCPATLKRGKLNLRCELDEGHLEAHHASLGNVEKQGDPTKHDDETGEPIAFETVIEPATHAWTD